MRVLVEQLIEALHESERCPRLLINGDADGVIIPDHVRSQWGESLPIDLDPNFPLQLEVDDDGLACCLSFGGPFECFFPWSAIYVVQDRDSQLGIVIEENIPEKVRAQVQTEGPDLETTDLETTELETAQQAEIPEQPARPRFTLVQDDEGDFEEPAEPTPAPAEAAPMAATPLPLPSKATATPFPMPVPALAPALAPASGQVPPPPGPASRRASFRVIEGGKA